MLRYLVVASLCCLSIAGLPAQDQPKSNYEVMIESPTSLSPDVATAIRITTLRSTGLYEFSPVPGAKVVIDIVDDQKAETRIGEGVTDPKGTVGVKVQVPELPDGERTLRVRTSCDLGKTEHAQRVKITRDTRILLTTDKPLYQPGQTVNIRALALSGLSLKPAAAQKVKFEIEDAKGNKVFKQERPSSEFGVSSIEFLLADEVNMGAYKLTASIGQAAATKSFEVKKYVLPKFKVDVKTEKKFYRPQETVKGSLEARYFFGKAVEKGFVTVVASTFDVAPREFAKIELKTDGDGKCEFEFKLPDYFVGQPLEKGNAFAILDIHVMDQAEHMEHAEKRVTVCSQPVLVGMLPESGRLVTGVENMVYVVASNPIGEPQQVQIKVALGGQTKELKTNENGFGSFTFVPETKMMRAQWTEQGQKYLIDTQVTVTEKGGAQTGYAVPLFADLTNESLLVRPDKGIYKTGEKLVVDLLGTAKTDTIFFDIVRKGQTQMTDMVETREGRGRLEFQIPQDLFGTVELHAYKLLRDGTYVRDTRLIYIEQTQSLKIQIDPDKPQYLPGDEATIRFEVTDLGGAGVVSALGVMVVDEAVYALQEMQPGLEKVYFMLEQEILKPQVDIKVGGDLPGAIGMPEDGRRQEMAKMLLANVEVPARRWSVNTLTQRFAEALQKVHQIYAVVQNQLMQGDAKKFTRVNAKGERELLPDVVEIAVKAGGLPDAKDSWGKPITLEKLEQAAGFKIMDYVTRQRTMNQISQIWQSLEKYVAENDAVENVKGQWKYKAGVLEALGLAKEMLKDGWGDSLTTDRLAELSRPFAADNIARLTDDERKFRLFEALIGYAQKNVAVVKSGSVCKYKEGLLDQLGLKAETLRSIQTGKRWDLEELGRTLPIFRPEVVLSETILPQRVVVWNGVLKAVIAEGVEILGEREKNGTFTYKPSALKTLVDKGYLKKSDIQTATGGELGWAEIQGQHPYFFELRAMAYTAIGRKWTELYRKVREYCIQKGDYKQGRRGRQGRIDPPLNLLQEMLDAKAITREHLKDPFGGEIRFLIDRDKPFVQWEHEGRHLDFVSCGPDGKFDTGDDYRFSQQGYRGYDHVQAPQRTIHYPKDHQTVNRHIWEMDDRNGEAEDLGFAQGGRGGGLERRRFGGDPRAPAPGAPMPDAAPMEKAAQAQANRPAREEAKKEMEAGDKLKDGKGDHGGGESFQEPTRVREWFPETLAWNPQIITDERGVATMKLPIADSITSWRLSATASSRTGLLGSATRPLVVFQDFFVDIDFPVSLTQNDLVWVPVAVFNYLKEPQKVKLQAEPGAWFEMLDDATKIIEIGSNEIKAVYYKIRVTKIGNHSFTVKAAGTKFSDAVRRGVEVVPDGKKFEEVINQRLPRTARHEIQIPAKSVQGSSKIIFKVFPGVMAQIVDGLDGMLRLPGG
jgi:hypothetical protein